jgi:hypothetical protein
MRTTLTLDPDVALRLQQRLEESKASSMKDVVNEALRVGLSQPPPKSNAPYRVQPFSLGLKPGIDPDKLNQVLDEMEAEQALERLRADS